MDEVESFLQSMMETIAAAIASLRVGLCRVESPPAIVRLGIFLPSPNGRGFSSAKPFHHGEIHHRIAVIAWLLCHVSPSCQSDICRVSLTHQAEIYIATLVDFAGQGISSAFPIIRLHCSQPALSQHRSQHSLPHIIATCDGVIECPRELSSLPRLLATHPYSGHSHARICIVCA